MKLLLIFYLITAFFVTGCVVADYFLTTSTGAKLVEIEKPYSKSISFDFQLNESSDKHSIIPTLAYSAPAVDRLGAIQIELLGPAGSYGTKNFTLRGTHCRGGSLCEVPNGYISPNIVIIPKQGNYTLNIIELPGANFEGKNVKLEVYKR